MSFFATMAGALMIVSGLRIVPIVGTFAVLALIGQAVRSDASGRMSGDPDRAVRTMQVYILWAFALIAATTAFGAWVGLNAGDWLSGMPDWVVDHARLKGADGKPTPAAETASTLIAGAITSLAAFLWSKGASDTDSVNWPSGAAKASFQSAFKVVLSTKPGTGASDQEFADYTEARAAVEDDEASTEVSGWDLPALQARIAILRRLRPDTFPKARN